MVVEWLKPFVHTPIAILVDSYGTSPQKWMENDGMTEFISRDVTGKYMIQYDP